MSQQVFPVMSAEQVDRLIAEENLYNAELVLNSQIHIFLLAIKSWKDNAIQGQGKQGFVLPPPPTPPAGYVFIDTPPVSTAPPALGARIVGERNADGTYNDYGHQSDYAGTVIDNPFIPLGPKLIKVIRRTPFGPAHYWIEKV